MSVLHFPVDRIVGTLDWASGESLGSGPTLARGSVEVPDGVRVDLDVQSLSNVQVTAGGGWQMEGLSEPADLGFLRELPHDAVESLTLHSSKESSFEAVAHLAPGLRRLYLVWSELTDAVLGTVAQLTGLTYLQSFGNAFTDLGVQQLASLTQLDHLYLEEETLSADAFAFAEHLARLTRLGLQDVPITPAELDELRARLPGVDVG